MKLIDRIPTTPWIPVILGILMTLPTLSAGIFMDDVLVRTKLSGVESPWTPAEWWDLYTFAREDINAELLEAGHHPWWAHPEVKMTFFRPLSAATHHFDHWLFPDQPMLHHLHSVLWYGLAIFMVYWVLAGIYPNSKKLVLLASIAFAVATPHAMTVGWLAGRNTIISFVAALLYFDLYRRWRTSHKTKYLLSSLGLFIVALLTGEAALGGIAYLLGWELFMVKTTWSKRLLALTPHLSLFGTWYLLYTAAGFGAANTGIYHDPSTDPGDFALAVASNFPVLMLGKWILMPLDFWAIIPWSSQLAIIGIGVLFTVFLGWMLWPLLKKQSLNRLWAFGMVAALGPFTATLPMDRLVLFAGLGAAALLAQMVLTPTKTRIRKITWKAILILHLPLAALLVLFIAATLDTVFAPMTTGVTQAPVDAQVTDQTFVYLSSNFHRVHYTTLMRTVDGKLPVPKRSMILSSTTTANAVTRTDATTLEITPEGGFMDLMLDQIHRRSTRRFAVGDRVQLPDAEVEILELNDQQNPARAAFHFRVPLEDPSLRWLVVEPEDGTGFPPVVTTREFQLPAIGETVILKSAL